MLCIFEDNEAVIKMILKGRSPTMRRVSRTHRIALDWLFDRINPDPKIQIKDVDTKHQLADILTRRNFTRDEWNNFLHLLTSAISAQFPALRISAPPAALKRWHKGSKKRKGEERIVAKSKPTLNLVSHAATSSSTVQSPLASKSLGILRAPVNLIGRVQGDL